MTTYIYLFIYSCDCLIKLQLVGIINLTKDWNTSCLLHKIICSKQQYCKTVGHLAWRLEGRALTEERGNCNSYVHDEKNSFRKQNSRPTYSVLGIVCNSKVDQKVCCKLLFSVSEHTLYYIRVTLHSFTYTSMFVNTCMNCERIKSCELSFSVFGIHLILCTYIALLIRVPMFIKHVLKLWKNLNIISKNRNNILFRVFLCFLLIKKN